MIELGSLKNDFLMASMFINVFFFVTPYVLEKSSSVRLIEPMIELLLSSVRNLNLESNLSAGIPKIESTSF